MSKYPEYKHTKSRAWFDRALEGIPSGIYDMCIRDRPSTVINMARDMW